MRQFVDLSIYIRFLYGHQSRFGLLFLQESICIFGLLLDHYAIIYFTLSLFLRLDQLCFQQCNLLCDHAFYLMLLFCELLLKRLHTSFVLHVVLHYRSFHWIIGRLPPNIWSRLKQSSTRRAIAPSAFVHLGCTSGRIVAFASQVRWSFRCESWEGWNRTRIALQSDRIRAVHFDVFHTLRVVMWAVFVDLNELSVIAWTEELTVFLIGFNFGYLSYLVYCVKVWVFQVFKFKVIKSVLFLNGLHLFENDILVLC